MSNGTTPAILGLLGWKPMTGYELKTALDGSVSNFWSESFGQIYPELRRLAEQGLVTSTGEGEDSGKLRRRYAITARGREVLKNWLAEPPKHRPPRSGLLLKVFFASQGDMGEIIKHVEQARRIYADKLAAIKSKEDALKTTYPSHPDLPLWLITLSNGRHSYAATIAWCDETIETLNNQQNSAIASPGRTP